MKAYFSLIRVQGGLCIQKSCGNSSCQESSDICNMPFPFLHLKQLPQVSSKVALHCLHSNQREKRVMPGQNIHILKDLMWKLHTFLLQPIGQHCSHLATKRVLSDNSQETLTFAHVLWVRHPVAFALDYVFKVFCVLNSLVRSRECLQSKVHTCLLLSGSQLPKLGFSSVMQFPVYHSAIFL